MSFPERQYDQPRTHNHWVSVPHSVPGRLNATDFVFLNYDSSFPAHLYRVAVESASNASPSPSDRYRNIGALQNKVELPDVHFSQGFDSHAKILILPTNSKLPAYMGNLVRGSTYAVTKDARTAGVQDFRLLERTGVH